MKNNKNNNSIKGIISIVLVLSAIAIGIIFSYPYILSNSKRILDDRKEEETKLNKEADNEQKEQFLDMLFRSNYSLYTDIASKNKGVSVKPSDIYLPDYEKTLLGQIESQFKRSDSKEVFTEKEEEVQNEINSFNEVLDQWRSTLYDNDVIYFELEYYIVDNKTKNYLTNTVSPLKNLLNDDVSVKTMEDPYSFYGVFSYDSKGKLEIPVLHGFEGEKKAWFKTMELTKQLMQREFESDRWYEYNSQIKSPTNVTIIYAVKGDDFYKGDNTYSYFSGEREGFHSGGFMYVFSLSILLVIITSIFLTLKKNWGAMKVAGWIPGEISVIGVLIPFMFYEGLLDMAWQTASGSFMEQSDVVALGKEIIHILNYSINYIVWMVVLGIFLLCLISLWQFFTLGIKRYLKEKTILGRCYCRIKQFVLSLKEIDLTDSSNKFIFKIVAVNFVILAVLCSIWVVGIIGVLIYSILLFFLIKKYADKIKEQFQVLLNATSKMAAGNLEAMVEEDLGIFNPLKEELSKVQYGFKTAVEEEMKSQRMKTELISNVSHDLKTPLTAIITYIDLLKDNTITQEERNSYIDTLDKKSMRLKGLIEDLFEMSKVNSNNIQLTLVDVDIISLIKQVQLELGDQIKESKIEFRNRFPEKKIILKLDSEKTYRIFENLIINITKYSLSDTRAYAELTETADEVLISLKNISATELDFAPDEITERFVRGDTSRNTEGSGLGLAIAKSFVEHQGGRFEILLDGDLFKVNLMFRKEGGKY